MADVILAEYSSQAWLVRGEQHMDELLAGLLPPHVSIEVVTCESKLAVNAMYFENGGEDLSEMWLIHPGIVRRSRGLADSLMVLFTEWSAALDERATEVLKAAATMAERKPGKLTLVRHLAADAPAMATGLADLRSSLIEGRLVAMGIDPERLMRDTVSSGDAEQADRIGLVIREA